VSARHPRTPRPHPRTSSHFVTLVVGLVFSAILVASASPALAKGRKPAGGGTPTGSFSLVMVADKNSNGLPNWDDAVTFNVTSTAQYTFVDLRCYQNGSQVLYVSHQIPGSYFTTTYYLKGYYWVPGAADCTARLYSANSDMTNQVTLATMDIHVDA
jgi:hypothetical protein